MSTYETTHELLKRARAILLRELGPANYIRYIQHFEKGTGDYTRDRHNWLPSDPDVVRKLVTDAAAVREEIFQENR